MLMKSHSSGEYIGSGRNVTPEYIADAEKAERNLNVMLRLIDIIFSNHDNAKEILS